MEAHVLNGDALAEKFPVEGDVVICRECLIDGPVKAASTEEFWNTRATYIEGKYNEERLTYFNHVKAEFEKLKKLASSINLWFEHDLFCQANMWFVISYIHENKINLPVYRVMPPARGNQLWSGFGPMQKADLLECFDGRIKLTNEDLDLGVKLWQTYQSGDLSAFKNIATSKSPCFPLLSQVCEAHLQRYPRTGLGRPQKKLVQILNSGITDFNDIFKEFWKTEGIYGFGDLQVKDLLASL
jgi:hypothetical protein